MPLLAGGLLELPVGVLAGQGRRRRLAILGGGVIFVLTLLGVASARSFTALLCAFVAFYPASGAFVSLTQAEVMARWDLAGSTGAVAGPLLLTAVLASGGGWRVGYLVLAGIAAALRDWGTLRWLLLIEVADLLVDTFTGFLALYLVDIAHLAPAVAALAIAIRLGAALAGDAALVMLGERAGDLAVLRVSAVAAALLYPGFLLVPGIGPKLVVLAALSAATAPWYPLLQARLYGSLPGRSSVAVTLSSATGLVGGLGPLAVGLVAQGFGLSWALAGLVVVPVAVLLVSADAGPAHAV